MNSTEFNNLYNSVKFSLRWKDAPFDLKTINQIASRDKTRFIKDEELTQAIDKLNNFNINLLWDKSFWGLKVSESICAVASEKYSFLRKLRDKQILT